MIVDIDTGSYVVGDPMTAAVMFIEAPIIIDGFELQAVEKSACAIAAISAQKLHRFHLQGASILDTETGIEWLRCGATKLYDWTEARCVKPSTDKGLSRASYREAQLVWCLINSLNYFGLFSHHNPVPNLRISYDARPALIRRLLSLRENRHRPNRLRYYLIANEILLKKPTRTNFQRTNETPH